MMGWVVDAPSSGTLSVQYLSTIGGAYKMVNDGNGVPNMQIYRLSSPDNGGGGSDGIQFWSGTANTKGNHNFGAPFTTLSSVAVPKKDTYLVLSSYRIRHNGNVGSFIGARLTYPGGSSKTRMIVENFNPTSGFNNYGGSVRAAQMHPSS